MKKKKKKEEEEEEEKEEEEEEEELVPQVSQPAERGSPSDSIRKIIICSSSADTNSAPWDLPILN